MKKIGFIGAYDKIDFMLYIAKVLVEAGYKVLVVDGTITQKARYTVPAIESSRIYITQFEGIDVSVGLKSFEEIKQYIGIPETNELPYDIVLIDTDSMGGVASYRIQECEKVYFMTCFDLYSIKKGIESISAIQQPINATKILVSRNATKEENEYLNYLSSKSNINWNDEIIYLPFELGDQTVMYKNQRLAKIRLRELSTQFKEGLMYTLTQILGEENYKMIIKVFKKVERGV